MKTTLQLDTNFHVGPIDRRIFSGFLEHLGRAVYEGAYDPGNPRSDANGFRRDVLDALRPLGMPLVRWPGGNFVSNYDWRDGVGPRGQRKARPDYAWKSIEPNTFGTDEFIDWCRELHTQPLMAINLGTGTVKDAAELVEYCNLAGGTYWADRRIANGHREPHGVKTWCLGNEMDGPWQAGYTTAADYALRAGQAAKLMRGLDPTIELVAAGSTGVFMPGYMEWDRTVLEHCWDDIHYLSAHHYSADRQKDSAHFLGLGVDIDRMLADYAAAIDYVRARKRSSRRIYVSFDEWNVWHGNTPNDGKWTQAPHLLEEVYTLEGALVTAQYLTSFIRRADLVKIACVAQIVNVIAPILTRPEGVLLQSIYYPFALMSQHVKGNALRVLVDGPTYKSGDRGEIPALDAAASFDAASGQACVVLINRDQKRSLSVDVTLDDKRVKKVVGLDVLTGKDIKASNSWEKPNAVRPAAAPGRAKLTGDGGVRIAVPAPGMVVARLALGAR